MKSKITILEKLFLRRSLRLPIALIRIAKLSTTFLQDFVQDKCLKEPKITCLVALNKKYGLFWSFWFMSDRGVTQTINCDQYCSELDFLLEETILIMPFVVGRKFWLQQDGTTAHKANAALNHVKNVLKTNDQLQH